MTSSTPHHLMPDSGPHDTVDDRPLDDWMCAAKTRAGGKCRQPKMVGRGRCRLHGGKSRRGVNSPTYKDGRRMRVIDLLKPDLRKHADAVLSNPNRLDLGDIQAVLTASLAEVVGEWQTGQGGPAWLKAREHIAAYQAETRKGEDASIPTMQSILGELFLLIEGEAAAVMARKEVLDVADGIRKVTETERRRRAQERQMVTREFLVAMFSRMWGAVARRVASAEERQAVFDDFSMEAAALALNAGQVSEGQPDDASGG